MPASARIQAPIAAHRALAYSAVMTQRRLVVTLAPFFLLFGGLLTACSVDQTENAPVVLAAASLQEAMSDVADAWAAEGHTRPVIAFAGSSALARQLIGGAPADLFISADEDWMDAVAAKNLLREGSRVDLLANRLVLIVPINSPNMVSLDEPRTIRFALTNSRLAIADTDAVPAGKYGKAALQHLGLWDEVADQIAPSENVRAALALVERREASLGIVYATDAKASDKVRVVATFPEDSHPAIRYPVAQLRDAADRDADAFRTFLTSEKARRIFVQYGFQPLP